MKGVGWLVEVQGGVEGWGGGGLVRRVSGLRGQ